MKNYVLSVAATRFSGKGMELECGVVWVQAQRSKDALDVALAIARDTWPRNKFWNAHTARIARAEDVQE